VPLKHLRTTGRPAEGGLDGDLEDRVAWELTTVSGGQRTPLYLPADLTGGPWPLGEREVSLFRTRQGDAALVERAPRPRVTDARWTPDGALELRGDLPPGLRLDALIVESSVRGERHEWPAAADAPAGQFTARLEPAAVRSLAGVLALAEDSWFVLGRLVGEGGSLEAPAVVARAIHGELPLATVAGHKPFALGVRADHSAVLVVGRDHDEQERGAFHQRRLQDVTYPAARAGQPLRDAVVFASFGGRQYSDSPRAIHEELLRRGTGLEQLWVVRDGQCVVPPSATRLREGSREYYDAMATARYVVSNDHFPPWFVRRTDQVCLQTWHGTPLKRLGLDVSDMRKTVRRFQRGWNDQVGNWQYVLSPNRFSTPILRRAYAIEGEMLETGYPRVDQLAAPDREERTRALRARLGLPDGKRVVLYAPTYRDQVVDRRGRYRLDLRLDVERLREAVGHDTVILFRKHHYIVDAVPATADGFVRDVSDFPDGTELMLAADVLVTDYSSMAVDFANTGRPMLFFTYDLETYADEIRGFYLDFVNTVPGPLLRTNDELADALVNLDAVQAQYAERYADFRRAFCELDDGGAAVRVVDRIFGAA
jgi:CDP-glycerol glycerophosphotransferase